VEVARALLGKILAHGKLSGRIVETEAYLGVTDAAAHAYRGVTPRTRVLFGPPGHAYVYLIYGIHDCLNIVAEPEGAAGCVLIRAIEPRTGITRATDGPGKLTQALGISGEDYGRDLCGDRLFLEDAGRTAERVGRSARINVDYAGAWAAKRWRFYERGNRYVSVHPRD
jgi:DNA-3-methyladenine glycosylase